ncbi:hypothetical protein MASR1M66_11610 [Aminivibrio sp.]
MGVYIIAEAESTITVHCRQPLLRDVAAEAGSGCDEISDLHGRTPHTAEHTEGSVPEANNRHGRTCTKCSPGSNFPLPDHEELLERCVERGIDFLSSPFDEESLIFWWIASV